MSLTSMMGGRSRAHHANGEVAGTSPPPYARRPLPPPNREPHQLGSDTLQSVDALTAVSADEIEKVAEQLENAAREVADGLREAARRVRHSGIVANERLANFVRVASTCADAARIMQQSVEQRDDPNANPPSIPVAVVEPASVPTVPADLDALAEKIDRADAPDVR